MGFVLVTDLKCVPYIHSHNQLSKWNTVFFLLNWLRNQRLKLTDLTEICAIISRQSAFSLIQVTLLETVLLAFFPHCCWLWKEIEVVDRMALFPISRWLIPCCCSFCLNTFYLLYQSSCTVRDRIEPRFELISNKSSI